MYFLTVLAVIIYILLLRNKKAKNAKLERDSDTMLKEGNFKGLKVMFGRLFILWGILFLSILTISIIQVIRKGGLTGWVDLIVSCVVGYRAFILGRAYFSYRKAEKYLSYRLSDEEVGRFWEEENDEELVLRLHDYIRKKSFMFQRIENLNEVEKNIMMLIDLESEVDNGGFEQFFDNTKGEYNDSLIQALTAVNAPETAKIVSEALDINTRGLLEEQRRDMLRKACDTPFHHKTEDLISLMAEYARKNKDALLS